MRRLGTWIWSIPDGSNLEWLVIVGVIAALVLVSWLLGITGSGVAPHPGGGLIEQ